MFFKRIRDVLRKIVTRRNTAESSGHGTPCKYLLAKLEMLGDSARIELHDGFQPVTLGGKQPLAVLNLGDVAGRVNIHTLEIDTFTQDPSKFRTGRPAFVRLVSGDGAHVIQRKIGLGYGEVAFTGQIHHRRSVYGSFHWRCDQCHYKHKCSP